MNKFYSLTTKSLAEFGVKNHAELWKKAQEQGFTALSVGVTANFTKAEGDDGEETENRFNFVFSTAAEDRHRDIVEQNWELTRYRKNPVILDSHNYFSIEHIIGRARKIAVKDERLSGEVEFALENPRGLLAYKLVQGGFLNATSVGFIPKEFTEEGNIARSELLEVSMVSVPANHEALAEKSAEEIAAIMKSEEQKETQEEEPKVETPQEETPQDQAVEEPAQDPVPEPVVEEPSDDTPLPEDKSLLTRVDKHLADYIATQKQYMSAIARELSKTTPANLGERKRKIYQHLRDALQS